MAALGPWLLVLPATMLLFLLLVLPVAGTLKESFDGASGGLLDNYQAFFADEFNRVVLVRSFKIAFMSTFVSLVAGFLGAYMIANASPNLKRVLLILSVFPLLTSVVVRSFSFMAILGRNGVVNTLFLKIGLIDQPLELLFTQGAVVAGLAYLFTPLMILSLVGVLGKYRRRSLCRCGLAWRQPGWCLLPGDATACGAGHDRWFDPCLYRQSGDLRYARSARRRTTDDPVYPALSQGNDFI